MIRIAIVEDDAAQRRRLSGMIAQYFSQKIDDYTLTEFEDGDDILQAGTSGFDVVFLDIMMARVNGMQTARAIREKDDSLCIVFVTNMVSYAIDGYGVNALDFLVKPVSFVMVEAALRKLERTLEKRGCPRIVLQTDRGLVRLEIPSIWYIETHGHDILVHADSGEYRFRGTIREMETKLQSYSFCRCNSGLLVNLHQVQGIQHMNATVHGCLLPISRGQYRIFMDALTTELGSDDI